MWTNLTTVARWEKARALGRTKWWLRTLAAPFGVSVFVIVVQFGNSGTDGAFWWIVGGAALADVVTAYVLFVQYGEAERRFQGDAGTGPTT